MKHEYIYRCWKCGLKHRIGQNSTEEQRDLKCSSCGRSLLRVNHVPGVVTDSTFMSGVTHDDGIQSDWVRKRAIAKAKAAGVDVSGARYCPELCPPGESLSPKAWVKSRADVVKRAKELGRGVEGSVSVPTPAYEPPEPTPYVVSDKIVDRRVKKILSESGATKETVPVKEYSDLWHREQALASGTQ